MKKIKTYQKNYLALILFILLYGCDIKESNTRSFIDYPIKPVPFTEVKIEDNFWKKRIQTNDEVTIPATFKKPSNFNTDPLALHIV